MIDSRLRYVCFGAGLLAVLGAMAAGEAELIRNGGFEAARVEEAPALGWTSQGDAILTDDAAHGKQALHVTGGYVIASQRISSAPPAEQAVTFTFRARGGGAARCGAIIQWHDGTRFRPSRLFWDAALSPFRYRRFARTVSVPAEARGPWIVNIYNTAKSGSVWLDDVSVSIATERTPSLGNVAQGCAYEMTPRPRYGLCTDAEDVSQLTDGAFARHGRSLWTQQEAVGWQHSAQVEIMLDLGSVQSVGGLVFHTAAGGAGVHLPASIEIHVSSDEEVFRFAGDLMELNETPLDPDAYAVVALKTTRLRVRARHIRLTLIPFGVFAFCDEVEVLQALPGTPSAEYPADTPEATTMRRTDTRRRLITRACQRRMRNDLDTVMDRLLASVDAPGASTHMAAARTLFPRLEQFTFTGSPNEFRAVIPLNELHRDVFRLHAALVRGDGAGALSCWQTPPDMPLDLFVEPEDGLVDLRVELLSNEHRAAVFNLSNSRDTAADVRFSIDGLPGGQNPAWVSCSQVEYVGTMRGRVAHSALTPLTAEDGVHSTEVPAGMTRQVRLGFHPIDVAPGDYEGTVSVHGPTGNQTLPLRVRVLPLTFPAQTTFAYQVWDYADSPLYSFTSRNRPAVLETLRSHGATVAWCARDTVPWPDQDAVDADGNLIRPPDFSRFDRWVKSRPEARYFLMFDYRLGRNESFREFPVGSPGFTRLVGEWARELAAHVKELGVGEARVGLLIKDEPRTPEHFELTRIWATAIKAGSPDILLFIDPGPGVIDIRAVPGAAEAVQLCDIICPCTARYDKADEGARQFFADCVTKGKQLWFYDAVISRDANPCFHYRGRAWHCWTHGATGGGDWSLAAAGCPNSWNEYITPGALSYSPLYVTPDGISTSKQWEAAREGVQDYEILHMLSTLVSAKPEATRANEARLFLKERPAEIAALTRARDPKAYEAMANARLEALELLCEIAQERAK